MKFTYQGNKYSLILFTLAGSRFYGTSYEIGEHPFKPDYQSDHDWRGVFIADPDTKLGLTGKIEEIEVKKNKDGTIPDESKLLIDELNKKLDMDMEYDTDLTLYEIKKFVTLSLDANPNILDIIYTDDEAVIYENKKGKKLREEGKDIFMSTKTKFTFSGYANSQLKRVKGHNRWIVKYPKTNEVFESLKLAFGTGDVDYAWITDYFGGKVSEYVTGMSQQEANKLGKVQSIRWSEFVEKYECKDGLSIDEWNQYAKPRLIDYVTAKDLKAKKLSMDTEVNGTTVRDLLLTEASFRKISNTQYNIFTAPDDKYNGGIFARDGKLKNKDPEEVGNFAFQLSIDDMNYKKDLDNIQKLWEWRTGRNEKRSVLEEHFGYDVKHCSHLFRLLIGAKNILSTGEYHPRLTGDNLVLVKSILNGDKPYDWIIEESEKIEVELETLYKSSKLPKTPNHKKANELLLDLSRKF